MQYRSESKKSRTRILALTASFAVLYSILRLIPSFPMIGVAGTFSASDFIAPVLGILLGPWVGGASIVLGTFLAIAGGRPTIFLGLDFLPGLVGAVSVGLLMRRKFLFASILYVSLLIIFVIHPLTVLFIELPGGTSFPYNWLHVVALILLISPLSRKAVSWVSAPSRANLAKGMVILCFIGTLAQHLAGGVVFASILGLVLRVIQPELWPGIWTGIFFLYPVERAIITIIAALVGSAVYRRLNTWLEQIRIS